MTPAGWGEVSGTGRLRSGTGWAVGFSGAAKTEGGGIALEPISGAVDAFGAERRR